MDRNPLIILSRMAKRTFARAFGRRVRRRRMVRPFRRNFRRVRRSRFTGITNRNSAPSSYGRFRTRKIRAATFRRILYRDTMFKQHYRSVLALPFTMATPANLNQATVGVFYPGSNFPAGTQQPFWQFAAGAQSPDPPSVVPDFFGDIILRGGISSITIANRVGATEVSPTDCVRVTVFTVWKSREDGGFTLPTTVSIAWDPSVVGDFQKFGRVIGRREALLHANGEVVELKFRHRVQKIDQNVNTDNFSATSGGNRLAYVVMVSQTSNSDLSAVETVDVTIGWNYSFSADALNAA